nr:hypothetical protein AUSP0071_00002 [uncultured phage]
MRNGRRGDPVTDAIVDERQIIHIRGHQVARVLTTHTSRIIKRGLHKGLGSVLIRHATLRAVGLPLAPRCRRGRIIHAEEQIIVTLDKDGAGQIRDGLLKWRLADVTRQLQHDTFAQITAQGGTVRIPQLERPAGRAPVAAATIDQGVQDGLQISAERIVQSVLFCPITASRVLGRVEAQSQAGGHATTRLVLVEQRFEDHARIRRVEGPLALVVAVREQMRGIVVFGLGQQPADRLAGIGDGLGTVVRLAAATSDDIARVVRLAIAGAVRYLHGHFEAIGKLSVECLRVAGKHGVFDADRAIVIVQHRSAEAHRLSQYADTRAERPVGHETSMQRFSHNHSQEGLKRHVTADVLDCLTCSA